MTQFVLKHLLFQLGIVLTQKITYQTFTEWDQIKPDFQRSLAVLKFFFMLNDGNQICNLALTRQTWYPPS